MSHLRFSIGRRLVNIAFNSRWWARHKGREHVLCLGDSHLIVMRHIDVPGLWLRPFGIGGATASGILNPQSQTRSFVTFTKRLQRAPRWQWILFMLGEVDCGFVIWHRAQRHGISIDEQLEQTLDAYTTFIARTVEQGFSRVIVMSAPLPTIRDRPEEWGEVASIRAEVKATIEERTALTLKFNAALRERCERVGAVFVDVTSAQLDPETGLIMERFRRRNTRNHHLENAPFGELVVKGLRPLAPSSQARAAG